MRRNTPVDRLRAAAVASRLSGWLLAVCALASTAASAAEPRELTSGQTITISQAGDDGTDMFWLAGVAGTTETIAVSGPGQTTVIAYSPDGAEILRASAAGGTELTFVLGRSDIHAVAVVRADRASGYTVKAAAREPSLAGYLLAANTGYVTRPVTESCWDQPGEAASEKTVFGDAPGQTSYRQKALFNEHEVVRADASNRPNGTIQVGLSRQELRRAAGGLQQRRLFMQGGKWGDWEPFSLEQHEDDRYRFHAYRCSER